MCIEQGKAVGAYSKKSAICKSERESLPGSNCAVSTEKMHNPRAESYVLFSGHSEDFKAGSQHLRKYREAVQKREEEEPGYIGVLATEDQIVGTSKDYCQSKKLRHIK